MENVEADEYIDDEQVDKIEQLRLGVSVELWKLHNFLEICREKPNCSAFWDYNNTADVEFLTIYENILLLEEMSNKETDHNIQSGEVFAYWEQLERLAELHNLVEEEAHYYSKVKTFTWACTSITVCVLLGFLIRYKLQRLK